ncbi:MAG: hypothetical protein KF681_10465 [Bdellovibrionaceae bacterium]|nr:hypothetical protein [Pseudobdellovibrionaceae bacterium]
MSSKTCVCCQKSKPQLTCEVCAADVCKYCAQFLDEGQFSFMNARPEVLAHSTYCPGCFDQHVAGELAAYNEVLERAKSILVYEKKQAKETRLLSRKEKTVRVSNCADQAEAMLRLAFFAAKAGFNAIIDVDLQGAKVSEGGSYKTTKWSGTGVPSNVAANKIAKDRSLWQNPN